MKTITLDRFKSRLTDYAEKIQNGQEFVITEGKTKKKIFKVSPFVENKRAIRKIGPLDGKAKAFFSEDWEITDTELSNL
jgi:hypothetical protein